MNLHEYQARDIFAKYGLPVLQGEVATTPQEARAIAEKLGTRVVVKAQVHVGGRGKAGGVKLADTPEEAEAVAARILGMEIKGVPVRKVLVAQAVNIAQEVYLGAVLDRGSKRVVLMASAAGGVDIEEVARETPEKIVKVAAHPHLGLLPFQARQLAFGIGLAKEQVKGFVKAALAVYRAFVDVDASLAEINPLVWTAEGEWKAVDSKIVLDDNGLYRHPELEALRDLEAEPPEERAAREAGLSYVKLDGNIGCLVNGAGLAMTTMDVIKLYGGEPANFLDIGGGANAEKVEAALRIIFSDPKVKAVLINIFGGITRCDEVAKGVVAAIEAIRPQQPIVVRLVGTNEEEGRQILEAARLISATTLVEAAQKAVQAAGA